MKKANDEIFSGLGAPARRALKNAGIKTPSQLAGYTESDLLKFHGIGPTSIPKLRAIMKEYGLFLKTG